jgi:hypothetical protein
MTRTASRKAASLLDIDLALRPDAVSIGRDAAIAPETPEDIGKNEGYLDVEQTLAKIASIIRALEP